MPKHALFGEIAGGTPVGGQHALFAELTGGSAVGGKHGLFSEIPPPAPAFPSGPVVHVSGGNFDFYQGSGTDIAGNASMQENDLMLVTLGSWNAGAWTPPSSGWVHILGTTDGGINVDSYYKWATPGDIADRGAWVHSNPGTGAASATIGSGNTFRGVNGAAPIAASGHVTSPAAMPDLAGVIGGAYYAACIEHGSSGSVGTGFVFTPNLSPAGWSNGYTGPFWWNLAGGGAAPLTTTDNIGAAYAYNPGWSADAGFAAHAFVLAPQ